MANSYAQPILRTTNLAEALRIVEQLLEIADTRSLEVDFEARVASIQSLTPLMGLIPHAEWWSEEESGGSSNKRDDPAAHLPVFLQCWAMSPAIVQPLLKAVGDTPATVRWDFASWPAAPEVGLDIGGSRGAFVTLCVNARDLDLTVPATDHTVFVHVKQFEARRASWLASQIGLQVIGNLVMAPH
jgi:hypothetical protein